MKCRITFCRQDAVYKTEVLCRRHYLQSYNKRPFTDAQSLNDKHPIADGKKKCRQCKKTKPIGDFYIKHRTPNLRYFLDCKSCMKDNRQ